MDSVNIVLSFDGAVGRIPESSYRRWREAQKGTALQLRCSPLRDWLLMLSMLAFVANCSGQGCGGCAMDPLPEGGLPSDQTIEGGGQLRVTDQGFTKLTSLLPAAINDTFDEGYCVEEGSVGLLVGDLDYCFEDDGSCSDACRIDFTVDSIEASVPSNDRLRVRAQFDATSDVPVQFDPIVGGAFGCTLTATANNTVLEVEVDFAIRGDDGELSVQLLDIPDIDVNINVGGCGIVSDVIDFVVGVLSSAIENDFIRGILTPILNNFVDGLLPDPMGIEGVLRLEDLLGEVMPGTNAALELRMVPGGYVYLENYGMSLGIITGLNADQYPESRTPGLDSETAQCVPAFPAPDFTTGPKPLATHPIRQTFELLPADVFRGTPESDHDLLVGLSDTTLDLAGHHAISSGAFCLSIGTETIPMLNLGALGLLVPSLAELGSDEGVDPVLLVVRPAQPASFSIGDGTEESPSLTLHVRELEVDFYAFIFERYVRGFTVSLDLDVGLNLEFTTDASGNPAILPVLLGLEADNIGVTVLNEEFLREDKETLETVFPALLELVLPLVADGLGEMALPEFAGFRLDDLTVSKVSTSQDDFLAIGASLGASSAMMQLFSDRPHLYQALEAMAADDPVAQSTASARLQNVITPRPAAVRAGLAGQADGALPVIEIDVDSHDQLGRPLEWTWNLGGGMWRPFETASPLLIRDRALAVQGRHQVQLRSRVVGDYRTISQETLEIPVVIDSVGPRIHIHLATVAHGRLTVPASDMIYGGDVEIAFGSLESDEPVTAWGDGVISEAEASSLASSSGVLRVFARDPLGNQTEAGIDMDFALSTTTPAGCSVTDSGPVGWLLGLGVALFVFAGRRRRRHGRGSATVATLAVLFLMGGCASDSKGPTCEIDQDCADQCAPNQIPLCANDSCLCLDDVQWGLIGEYSAMDQSNDGTTWVSGYNSNHGDLMVTSTTESGRIPNEAWEFVDGVPDGPVVIEDGDIRGGINAPGDDVGRYTDIAVTSSGTPMVSYFDATSGSLKFAMKTAGAWRTHVVQAGESTGDPERGDLVAGRYTALSLRSDDDRPGIAFLAQIDSGSGLPATELRFAQALSAQPEDASDWSIVVVDSAPGVEVADVLPVPNGTGLFASVVRLSDESPVVVYYDRINGDLRMAVGDSAGFTFSPPEILDGADSDVGWGPSAFVDSSDTVHASYVDPVNHDLLYIDSFHGEAELVDDGYRLNGKNSDGLDKPEFHFVGDDSAAVLTELGPVIIYQDATSHELLMATVNELGEWTHTTMAGADDPFAGAYGFYAEAAYNGTHVTMSNWVVDAGEYDAWVEIIRLKLLVE